MNFRVKMGKMEKQCNFFSGFPEVKFLSRFFPISICVFLSRGDCVFFLDCVTPGLFSDGKSTIVNIRNIRKQFRTAVFPILVSHRDSYS